MAFAEALEASVQAQIEAKRKAGTVNEQWLKREIDKDQALRPLQDQVRHQMERVYPHVQITPEVQKAAATIERQPQWVQQRLARDAQREAEQQRGRELAERYREERPRFASRHRR